MAAINSTVYDGVGINNALSNYHKAMTRDSNGLLHVVYAKASTGIYHKSSTDDGATWSAEHEVAAAARIHISPAICVDSSDNLHVVYSTFIGNYDTVYMTSADAGATWGGAVTLWDGSARGFNCYHGSIGVDSSDNIFATCGAGARAELRKYTLATTTWEAVELVDADGIFPDMYVNSADQVWVIYLGTVATKANPQIRRRNTDGSYEAVVDLDNDFLKNATAVHITIASNDDVWACWQRDDGAAWQQIEENHMVGGAWQGMTALTNDATEHKYSTITKDSGDNIYIVWQNGNDLEIQYRMWTGALWEAKVDLIAITAGQNQVYCGGCDANIPSNQCYTTTGLAIVYGDDVGVPIEDNFHSTDGTTWPSGGPTGASQHPAMKKPLTGTPLKGEHPEGQKY